MKIITAPEFLAWFGQLPSRQRKQVQKYVDLLALRGPLLRMPISKHIDGPFFELRPTAEGVELRVFYALKGDAFILTGGQKNGRNSRRFYEQQIARAEKIWSRYRTQRNAKKPSR